MPDHQDKIERVLKWRGLVLKHADDQRYVILPKNNDRDVFITFFRYLAHYSFRLLLQDIIKFGPIFQARDLYHYVSPTRVNFYLSFLQQAGIIRAAENGTFQFEYPDIVTFGPTLQWYVCELLKRKFSMHAISNVEIANLNVGGDYDILATFSHYLLCVETKASPPKNIHQPAMDAFVKRKYAIGADLAILLTDTHLRMEDKINKMIRWALETNGVKELDVNEILRLSKGVFFAGDHIYIINSRPTIHQNIETVMRHFFGVKG